MNKSARVAIAYETLDILANGQYQNKRNEVVSISKDLKYAIEHTIHYKPEDFEKVFIARDAQLKHIPTGNCRIEVTAESTFAAARRLVVTEGEENVCCLNFASAKNPGGGFLGGAQAQEESLARASGLYPTLKQHHEMYDTNRAHKSLLYTEHMIYSPSVPVFRDDNDQLIDNHYLVSIITSPAVNRGALMTNEPENLPKIESVMLNRIENLLSVAVVNKHTSLILGAWGCGVFRNRTEDVAAWFAHHLLKNETFKNAFKHIVFAIYDPSEKKKTADAFKEQFGHFNRLG
ncbi:TIGR02452 family protein [Chitinophaga filiformis]|uniref:TIGR02452 family protein n=1 Tax=Chitinophaga filiformis TaxID=104663 RepID=UPI001F25F370|nr:TIGR02452 family protein [Chitinophaga filiformis]MCF6405655.1 TIGR02452 family protein [Chitinophaga filiformis]